MKKILYLGTDPKNWICEDHVVHHPVIKILPRSIPKKVPNGVTHIILTSKIAVALFLDQVRNVEDKCFISIGNVTALAMHTRKVVPSHIAKHASQEGVIECLQTLNLENSHFLLPHSSLSRPLIFNYLKEQNVAVTEWILYDTVINYLPLLDLEDFDEIVFTSPSTVHAFFTLYGTFPDGITLTAIGPITKKVIDDAVKSLNNIV